MIGALLLASAVGATIRESYIECAVSLVKSVGEADEFYTGQRRLLFLRETRGQTDSWKAWGHVDDGVEMRPDSPFPVKAVTTPNEIRLSWSIHRDGVTGVLRWLSRDHVRGRLDLRAQGHNFRKQTTLQLSMAGPCVRKPNPFHPELPEAFQ